MLAMMQVFLQFRRALLGGALAALATAALAGAQSEVHGRKYKPPAPTAHVVVTVEKGFNSKPLENAAVVFHATKDGKDNANLEVKTDPDGRATLDLLEVGSHVRMQIIANGFATYAEEFDLTGDTKEMTVKLQRPRAQISQFGETPDKPAEVKPGVQEHLVPKPATGATGSTGAAAATGTTGPKQ